MSPIIRSANSVEKMQVFCAWSSLRMSACTVPRTGRQRLGRICARRPRPGTIRSPVTPSRPRPEPSCPSGSCRIHRRSVGARAVRRTSPRCAVRRHPSGPCRAQVLADLLVDTVFVNIARDDRRRTVDGHGHRVWGAEVRSRNTASSCRQRGDRTRPSCRSAVDVRTLGGSSPYRVTESKAVDRRAAVAPRSVVEAPVGALRRALAGEHAVGLDGAAVRIDARRCTGRRPAGSRDAGTSADRPSRAASGRRSSGSSGGTERLAGWRADRLVAHPVGRIPRR